MQKAKRHKAKSKRGKIVLTITGAVILLLTYTLKEVVKEKTKDQADLLRSADAIYRSEIGLSVLTTQSLIFRQIDEMSKIEQIRKNHAEEKRDYSEIVRNDEAVGQQLLGELNQSFDGVSRYVDQLPSGAVDLRQALELQRPNIDKVNTDVPKVLAPVATHDWIRAVQVKLAIVATGTTEIPVVVLGDRVMTRSQEVQEACDKLYRFSGWAAYFLYAVGVSLTVYANLSGTKDVSSE